MRKRVLLGIDFIGANFPAALYTIQQWWRYVTQGTEYDCILGVSNFVSRHTGLPGADVLTPNDVLRILTAFIPPAQVVQWTSDIDDGLLKELHAKNIRCRPFYSEFSYGSIVNRLLLLASAHGCDYMVRIDPGTLPPKGSTFAQLMHEHENKIGNNPRTVVSRRYANRLALRDMFVSQGQENKHAKQVQMFTGIDVYAQITGGAMFTQKTPGTPAICFPSGVGLTLVWASDDGVYQILHETKQSSITLPDYSVERFDAVGKPKKSIEYYRGILGAVCLYAIREGRSRTEAEQVLDDFVRTLRDEILDADKCIEIDSDRNWYDTFCSKNIAPGDFLDAIEVGQKNHNELLQEWEEICTLIALQVVNTTSADNRLAASR